MSMATPIRSSFFNVAGILFRRQRFNTSKLLSLKIIKGSTIKAPIHKKIKVTFGLLTFPATFKSVMAASGEGNKALIDEVEAMYEKNDFAAMYDLLLPHKESKDVELLWRLARAATEKGKMIGEDGRKKHIYEAFEYIKDALKLDEKNFAVHKWYGILLDYTAEYEGNKQRISNAFLVKEHFMKAIELNPGDATTLHCLGVWCFLFADMPWYQRKIAGVIFATPPTSTYDEALKYFEDAEKAEPGFYLQNKMMWGKTLIRLKKDKDQAKSLLQQVIDSKATTTDDEKAQEEAKQLLRQV